IPTYSSNCSHEQARKGTALRIFLLAMIAGSCLTSTVFAVAPVTPVTPAGTQDQVFRVLGAKGVGTGTVFDYSIETYNGEDFLKMCIVTADHVLRNNTFEELGFRNESPLNNFPDNA